jgi:hypothetical protein
MLTDPLSEALDEASRKQPYVPDIAEVVRRGRRLQNRRRRVTVAGALLVAAAIVTGVLVALPGPSDQNASVTPAPVASPTSPNPTSAVAGASKLDRSYSAEGGTFRYPSAWRLSTYTDVSSFDTSVAYLSNYPIHDPCVHLEGNVSCSPERLGRLDPAGVLVSWDIYGFPNYGIDNVPGSSTTIDGRPARLQVKTPAATTVCAIVGASKEVDVAVATTSLHGAGGLWRMTACLADPGAAKAISTAIAVARSLRLAAPPPS